MPGRDSTRSTPISGRLVEAGGIANMQERYAGLKRQFEDASKHRKTRQRALKLAEVMQQFIAKVTPALEGGGKKCVPLLNECKGDAQAIQQQVGQLEHEALVEDRLRTARRSLARLQRYMRKEAQFLVRKEWVTLQEMTLPLRGEEDELVKGFVQSLPESLPEEYTKPLPLDTDEAPTLTTESGSLADKFSSDFNDDSANGSITDAPIMALDSTEEQSFGTLDISQEAQPLAGLPRLKSTATLIDVPDLDLSNPKLGQLGTQESYRSSNGLLDVGGTSPNLNASFDIPDPGEESEGDAAASSEPDVVVVGEAEDDWEMVNREDAPAGQPGVPEAPGVEAGSETVAARPPSQPAFEHASKPAPLPPAGPSSRNKNKDKDSGSAVPVPPAGKPPSRPSMSRGAVAELAAASEPLSRVSESRGSSRGSSRAQSTRGQSRGQSRKQSMGNQDNTEALLMRELSVTEDDLDAMGMPSVAASRGKNGGDDEEEEEDDDVDVDDIFMPDGTPRGNTPRTPATQATQGWITEADTQVGGDASGTSPNVTPRPKTGEPSFKKAVQEHLALQRSDITADTTMQLRLLLTGDGRTPFPDAYRQGFYFHTLPTLSFGLWQEQGGPCGVLAALQAHLLADLFHSQDPTSLPVPAARATESLISALTQCIWQCSDGGSATVVLPGQHAVGTSKGYKADGLTESLVQFQLATRERLEQFIRSNLTAFTDKHGGGVMLLVYSCILTRGIDGVRTDMDHGDTALIVKHGYCTQELVNLVASGNAASNVFNEGAHDASDSGVNAHGEEQAIKGITAQGSVGYLTIFEHFKYLEVGSHLKTPLFPVWIVNFESHFSVVFATTNGVQRYTAPHNEKFDLYFYDGLARQDELIRLTLDLTSTQPVPVRDDELDPPLELCLRTKWPSCVVDWNGSEPML